MIWWHRRKRYPDRDLDEYVARERAEVKVVRDKTRRQAETTQTLRAESSKVHEQARRIHERNGFTTWVTHILRGVQEDGR